MSVPSESDERVVNNTLRHQYRVLSEGEKKQMLDVKDAGIVLLHMIDSLGPTSRELAIARTKVEEAVMWAVKHITS